MLSTITAWFSYLFSQKSSWIPNLAPGTPPEGAGRRHGPLPPILSPRPLGRGWPASKIARPELRRDAAGTRRRGTPLLAPWGVSTFAGSFAGLAHAPGRLRDSGL